MPPGDDISIEIVFATATHQELLTLQVPEGSNVGQAIEVSELSRLFPGENFTQLQAGIWGRPVDRQRRLVAGDRIELYRPLAIDPRDARRALAAKDRSTGGPRRRRRHPH